MNMPTRDNPMFSDDDIIELTRSVEAHDFDRIAPPAQVWNNILAEVEEEVASNEASARRQSSGWFSTARLLSAAAVTLLMVGVAVAVVTFRGDDTPVVTELATAMLTDEGLPVSTSETASATYVCEEDKCFVELELSDLPDAGADDLELWVINGDVTDMFSLGLVTENQARYELPAEATVDGYPVVDISIEPDDGDAAHSGQSVLRGILDEA